MDLSVIIPVKPFADAKQRLAPALNPERREELAERMFRHVLGVTAAILGPASIVVVSRSPEVLEIAVAEGATALPESGPSDLNSALLHAVRFATARGHSRVLTIASDLPLLGEDDIAEIAGTGCAIAPDRHKSGTNALLWPAQLSFHFGKNSFARHRTIAETAGFAPAILVRKGLAHDIDVPGDLTGLDL